MSSDGLITLTNETYGTISFSNIIDYTFSGSLASNYGSGLSIGSKSYNFLDSPEAWNDYGRNSMHDGSLGHTQGVIYSADNHDIVLFEEGDNGYATFHASRVQDSGRISVYLETTALNVYGTSVRDFVSTSDKGDTVSTGSGDDQVYGRQGADTVNLGDGNDVYFLTYAGLSEDVSIQGAGGSDTLHFNSVKNLDSWRSSGETFSAVTVNMASLGNATGFENIIGSDNNDSITGDSASNVLAGAEGSDTLYGGGGDDFIYGADITSDSSGTLYGLRSYDVSSSANGNNQLFGQAGADQLFGGSGNDQLDGGTGADTITTGSGSDTIVLRVGDGGSAIANADTISDFTDGTDVFGLDDGLLYTDLTIAQGTGSNSSDTIISKGSEYLTILTGISASNINYYDFVSTATGSQTLNGTSGDDVLLGASGVDTVTTGTGVDVIITYGGDDAITIDGAGNKTIDGGAGTDSLTISVSGVTNLADYAVSMSSDGLITLTNETYGTISFSNIIDYTFSGSLASNYGSGLSIGSKSYNFLDSPEAWNDYGRNSMHDGSLGHTQGVIYSADNHDIVLFEEGDNGYATFHASRVQDSGRISVYLETTALNVYGTSVRDFVSTSDKGDTVSTGSGDDQVYGRQGADTVNLGDGNDVYFLTYAGLSEDVSIQGAGGSDTLHFNSVKNLDSWRSSGETFSAVTVNMASLGNATGFENIIGSDNNDSITGDSASNVLAGAEGSDTLYGGGGDDFIYGADITSDSSGTLYGLRSYDVSSSANGNNQLFGQAGADQLFGGSGNDQLDGGTGADTITTGSGSDTIVLRVGDGGSAIANADTISDFTDGTDVFGLDDGLLYTDLTIAQGTGSNSSDTIISKGSEYLTILTGISASNINYYDFVSTATGSQTLNGTSGDDVLLGASGVDTVTTGTGVDVIITYGGDDAITIDGAGNKTIDGGAGTDSLTISVSGVTSLADYAVSMSSDGLITLTNETYGTISFSNIIDYTFSGSLASNYGSGLSIGSKSYNFLDSPEAWNDYGRNSMHDGSLGHTQGVIYSADNHDIVLFEEGDNGYATFHASRVQDSGRISVYLETTALNVYGTSVRDFVSTSDKGDTVSTGSGDDQSLWSSGR